ncbi:VOC family protein [Nonomuraea sp. M3C6]|uniref:VOC family protein n=1 Tax=Nonomuraea marmarensis TaxID=3351344 RepID=A0ABW7AI64_9ACTN
MAFRTRAGREQPGQGRGERAHLPAGRSGPGVPVTHADVLFARPDPAHPQQAQLGLLVDDLDTGEARALELGASRLNAGGDRFRVFTEPAGHPFCLIR